MSLVSSAIAVYRCVTLMVLEENSAITSTAHSNPSNCGFQDEGGESVEWCKAV